MVHPPAPLQSQVRDTVGGWVGEGATGLDPRYSYIIGTFKLEGLACPTKQCPGLVPISELTLIASNNFIHPGPCQPESV